MGKAAKYTVVKCDELVKYIKDETGIDIEQSGTAITPLTVAPTAGPVEEGSMTETAPTS